MTEPNWAMPKAFWAELKDPDARTEYEALGVALEVFLPLDHVAVMTRTERRMALGAICLLGWFTEGDPAFLRSAIDLVLAEDDARMAHLANSIEAIQRPREEDAPEAIRPMGDLKGATDERFAAVREVERLSGHWLRWPWTHQKGTNQL